MPTLRPSGHWRGRVTDAQKRRYSASFTTREQAVRWEETNKQRVKDGLEVECDTQVMTVGVFFPYAAEELYGNTKSSYTRIVYAKMMAELIGHSKKLAAVTDSVAVAMKQHLIQRGMKPASIRNYTSVFNMIMGFAKTSGFVAKLVQCDAGPCVQTTRTRVVSPLEEEKIVKAFRANGRDDDADLVTFLIWSGLRWSEAMKLRVEDIDFKGGYLLALDTKNGDDRAVPLAGPAERALRLTILRGHLSESDKVFQTNYHAFRERLKRVLKRLRIEGVRIHAFRHTTGTRLAENDMSLPKIAKFLGHKSISTAERYTHLGNETMKELGSTLQRQRAFA